MRAYLYICDCTFHHNGSDTDKDVYEKVVRLGEMFQAIRHHRNENTLQINTENFLNTKLLGDNSTIKNILWEAKAKQCPRDAHVILLSLINTTPSCSYSYQDMIDTLSDDFEDENNINALVAMNKVDNIPESRQVLYDVEGFYRFRRYYVEKYPSQDPMTFLRDIGNYYDHIELNSDRKPLASKMENVMNRAKDIAHALTALNDDFFKEYNDKEKDGLHDTNHFLDAFAKRHSMDGGSTGRNKHKELYYNFEGKGTLYCGPHLKFKSDKRDQEKNLILSHLMRRFQNFVRKFALAS